MFIPRITGVLTTLTAWFRICQSILTIVIVILSELFIGKDIVGLLNLGKLSVSRRIHIWMKFFG